ncbi:MAG: 1-acyl-sn-glycerol-3-phosphate acyltransferase [Bacteriovoracaceae bacterium]|nr:1-acyl-sn-glycerol-3-phosphate acyltransferase [Bacteriovoracaceae bacterium]
MRRFLAFVILSTVKIFSWIFYRARFEWLAPVPDFKWKNIRLIVFLNHTSLYEPLFLQVLPFSFLWHLTARFSVPGADITLNRPIVGRFWKLMVPNISAVTRKKDASWENYLESIKSDKVVMIAPEGRMKRPNGLDKYGRPMTVRGGIADIIETLDDGSMLLCFSGGLHHVQAPGQHFPKLFKTIQMNFSYFDIKEYKSQFPGSSLKRKLSMVQDLQHRLETDCPKPRTL